MILYLLHSLIVWREDEWWSVTPSLGKLDKNLTVWKNGISFTSKTEIANVLSLNSPYAPLETM